MIDRNEPVASITLADYLEVLAQGIEAQAEGYKSDDQRTRAYVQGMEYAARLVRRAKPVVK